MGLPLIPLFVLGTAIYKSLCAADLGVKAATAAFTLDYIKTKEENKKLYKMFKLGLNPEREKFLIERQKQMARAIGADPDKVTETGEGFMLMELELGDLPEEQRWAAGKYLFSKMEALQFMDGLRHLALSEGYGDDAKRLRVAASRAGIDYDELGRLAFHGHGVDFPWLQAMSKARMHDSEFLGAAGIRPEELGKFN